MREASDQSCVGLSARERQGTLSAVSSSGESELICGVLGLDHGVGEFPSEAGSG